MEPDLRNVRTLGLALGGGGVLGAAHVGVLQVLAERGISPHLVVGTSAGAVVGAGAAAQRDPYDMERLVLDADWADFGTVTWTPRWGLLDTDALRRSLERLGGDVLIEDLPLRFGAVATDVRSRRAVVITSGPLSEALAASIAVPGLFAPVFTHGTVLADGGLVQNLPIAAAFDLGAEYVIAVRLAPEWDTWEEFRTSASVHEYEIRPDVTVIRPAVGRHSPWIKRGLPTLIEAGRHAAEHALRDYPVTSTPRRAGP